MATRPSLAYGIEYSGGRVTVARARRRKGGVDHEMLARDVDPAGDPAWKTLAVEIARDQASGAAVVSAAALAQDSFIRPVEAPFSSGKKAWAVLPSLLDVQLPFPLEQCSYQFIPMARLPGEKMRAMAVAMPLDRLRHTIQQLQSIGVDPEGIEPEAIALWRSSLKNLSPALSRPRVLLHLAHDRTIAVVGIAGVPETAFSARLGWSPDADAVARARLVARLQPFLAGALRHAGEVAPEFWVSGSGAHAFAGQLRDALEVKPTDWHHCDHPETVLAKSLAEGGLQPGPWTVNLRGGEFVHPHTIRRDARLRQRGLALVAGAALTLLVVSMVSVEMVKRRHLDLQREVQRRAIALTGLPSVPRGQELFVVRQSLAAAEEQYQPFREWLEPGAYPLFARLTRLAASRALTLETLSVRGGAVLARGSGADWNDTDPMVESLTQLGWKVEVERSDAGADERVHFTLRAQP